MKQREEWPIPSREMPLSTQIRGSEKKTLTGAWLALGLPLLIGWFFCGWGHMPFFMKPGVPNPIVCVLGLVAALMLARAIWETVRLKRFGDPVLDLTSVPVPLGGTVEGRISLGSGLTNAPHFNVKLQCIRRVLEQGGKNSHWVETVLWAGENTVAPLPGGIVPVSIAVPPDQEETDSGSLSNQIVWRLTVTAPFRGPSFLEKYEIPVEGRTAVAEKISEERAQFGDSRLSGAVSFSSMRAIFIIGLAIMAGGIYLLWLGIADLVKASASAGWPAVPGQVQCSIPPTGKALFVSRSDSDFAFTFAVNGGVYTGHTIYPHILWRKSAAQELTRTYPPGSTVTVYYSPGDPSSSCLVPGIRAGAFQRLLMALLVLTFGSIFAVSAVLAPRDAVNSGNSITFREGTTGSKIMGYSFLALIVWGVALWWVS
jgi:hypothetical protein